MEPIHLVKKYYGERFAFFFAYFVHYQAILLYPAFLGLLLFGSQMYWFGTGKYGMNDALDTSFNGAYGLFVSIWASVFVKSW
jgi:hypothetical protein